MKVNRFAGMGSHQSARSETDVWLTPPAIIEALGGASSFDLDPAAAVDRPWSTARQHYTIEDNGLILPWFGRIWLNPPYSNPLIARFMGRMAAHNRGVSLIFARTETDTFHRFVWDVAAAVLFLRGRINFCRTDGVVASENGGAPSVLIAYGEEDCEILSAAPIDGAFVLLRLPKFQAVEVVTETWKIALESFFDRHSGAVPLAEIYHAFIDHPKTRANQNWRNKIRQVLERGKFERVERGKWKKRAA